MKKYITIAALLAVGSAFASAADSYVWTGTGQDSDWLTAGNWELNGESSDSFPNGNSSDKTSAGRANRTKVDIGNDHEVIFSGSKASNKLYLSSLIVTIGEKSTLKVESTDPKVLNSTFYVSGEVAYTGNVWLGMPNEGNRGGHNAVGPEYILQTEAAVVSFGGTVSDLNTAYLNFSYAFATYSDKLEIKTKTLIESESASLDGLLSSPNFTFNTKAAVTEEITTLSNEDIGKYWLSYGDDNKSVVLNYVSGIPEPSAFGLLAGVGALALVAARRRRK